MNKLSVLEKGRQSALVVVLTLILLSSTTASATTYWSNIYDISGPALSIQPTSEGGFIATGGIHEVDFGRVIDFRVVKLNADGRVVWQRTYGGFGNNVPSDIQKTLDGSYIIAGETYPDTYNGRLWILKLDKDGIGQWQKTYGAGHANSILATSDGGYVTAGVTSSFGAGKEDSWVLKLDGDGNVQWQKTYGGTEDDEVNSVRQTSDGGYIIAGKTRSFGAGGDDAWILKLDPTGNVEWQKTYGGSGSDLAKSVLPTLDGGYIVAGGTLSFGAGGEDAWILKLDKDGGIQWQKAYGGGNYDQANSIRQTADGGYIAAGYTGSLGPGEQNGWLLKLDGNGNVIWQNTYGRNRTAYNYTSIYSVQETSDGGYITAAEGWLVSKLDNNGDISECSIIDSSHGTVSDTGVIGKDTNVQGADSTVVPEIGNTTSIDTDAGEYTLCLTPINQSIRINPTEIFFNPVLAGESMDESVTVTNQGDKDITIDTVTAPHSPFSVKEDLCSERLLVPGGSCTITVEFSPPYNYDNFYYGVLNIPLKDSYGSTFAVFLSGNPFITLSSPPNNASFDACSLYSPPTFAWKAARDFTNYQIMMSLEQPNRSQSFKVKTSGTVTEAVIPSTSWKRILSALGERGGRLKWEVFGALPPYHSTGTILIGGALNSEYRFINLDLSHPLGNPTISSTSKSSFPELSWQNNCNIKFKAWFGSDDNFNNRVTYTFNTKNPVDNEGQFNRTLTAGQWKSVRKLVGDENDSAIYWYVESWDGLGRYSKTDVMSFVLAD